MHSLFEEDKKEWFEIEQVCTVCGAHFMADYKYNSTCFSCRFKIEHNKDDKKEIENK